MISFTNLRHDAYGVRTLVCDTLAEVSKLPVHFSQGSKAYVVETGDTYILNGSRKWVKMKINALGGGAGNGDGFNYDEIIYDGGEIEDSVTEIIYDGGRI